MLETDRLLLMPFTRPQRFQYLCNDGSLEAGLGLPPARLEFFPDLIDAFEKIIPPHTNIWWRTRFCVAQRAAGASPNSLTIKNLHNNFSDGKNNYP